MITDDFLRKHKITVLDLEGYLDKDGSSARVWEYAFQRLWIDKAPILVSVDRDENLPSEFFLPLVKALKESELVVGHNIEAHDRDLLTRIIDYSIPSDKLWDTLKFEFILVRDQNRNSFALKTSHCAKDDVVLTRELFFSQVEEAAMLHDEFHNYKDVLSRNARIFLNNVLHEQIVVKPSRRNGFYYEEMFPLSDFVLNESTLNKELESIVADNRILVVAPMNLWGAVCQSIPSCIREVVFYTEDSNIRHRIGRISDIVSFGLDSWLDLALSRYHDNTFYKYVFQLPDYLIHYVGEKTISNVFDLDCSRNTPSVICIRPEESSLINKLPKVDKVIVVGGDSIVMAGFDNQHVSQISKRVSCRITFRGSPTKQRHRVSSVCLNSQGQDLKNRWKVLLSFITKICESNPYYTPVIITSLRFQYPDANYDLISDYCTKSIHQVNRRLEIARKNHGLAILSFQDFLYLNKRIEGDFLLYFDNFCSKDSSELDRNVSIIFKLSSSFFNRPKLIIADQLYVKMNGGIILYDSPDLE